MFSKSHCMQLVYSYFLRLFKSTNRLETDLLNSLWPNLVFQLRIECWRNQTEIAFHSNRSGKICLFSTKSTISFIKNMYITPKKLIISYRVWAHHCNFGANQPFNRRFDRSAGFRVGQGVNGLGIYRKRIR